MRTSNLFAPAALLSLASGAALAPRAFNIPDNNGFPNPTPEQLTLIAKQAGGKLPGGALPSDLGPASTVAFQLIAFNEFFETSYFSSLLNNITSGAPGYTELGASTGAAEATIRAVLAQEQQHALAAVAVLKAANKFVPSPCQYVFPVNTLMDSIFLAETFTALVLGVLQSANVIFASEGAPAFVRIVSSVIGQEGEQNGAYRLFLRETPSESGFLTNVPPAFAWSILQSFVVPGSCPFDISKIALPIFPGLTVNGGPIAVVNGTDQTLSFSADLKGCKEAETQQTDGLFVTFVNGQQLPLSQPAKNVKWSGSVVTLQADFPFEQLEAQGFSHASITTSGDFADVASIVDATLAAPGVIQVKKPLA
ncbi:hypothetical protein F5X68DRAFT_252668 [Plectosphaerella plurivora]|uniref:Late sexual development protein n=1 Tax=Plectosphaerella plurivora TaxID=936078 RepID=A0A9P9AAV6_9PEZI|nr:hypothetical protein F5X68DRAFT_252668 [Plectosphaerella plurivora]